MKRRGFLLTAGGLAAGGPSLMVPRRARAQAIDIKEVTTPLGIKAWLVEDHSVPVLTLSFSDRKSTRLNSSHSQQSRMPSSA